MSLFFDEKYVIRWSVRTFSWAGHNKVHFLVEGSLWVEALWEGGEVQEVHFIRKY